VTHQTTVSFEEEGNRTRLTMRMLFASAADLEFVVKTYKADEGGRQTLQRLANFLRPAGTSSTENCISLEAWNGREVTMLCK